jgi:hypothetical protein
MRNRILGYLAIVASFVYRWPGWTSFLLGVVSGIATCLGGWALHDLYSIHP